MIKRPEIEIVTVKNDIISLKRIIYQQLHKICSERHKSLLIKLNSLLNRLYDSDLIPTIAHIDRLRILVLNGDNIGIEEELYAFNKLLMEKTYDKKNN